MKHQRPLGKIQKAVLKALEEHKGWEVGCGWLWDTPVRTENIMESLVKRGYVQAISDGLMSITFTHYTITPEGKEVLKT